MKNYTVEILNSEPTANGNTYSPECLRKLANDINRAFALGTEFPAAVKGVYTSGECVYRDGKVILENAELADEKPFVRQMRGVSIEFRPSGYVDRDGDFLLTGFGAFPM